ncbi:MAG: energy transducer TonB [Desulfamplus sp.]|nr:energy transducer TonB [Desulfamplus sp.]
MITTLGKDKNYPVMGIMITLSLIAHLFLFLHISERFRLTSQFEKEPPPIKIEIILKEISKSPRIEKNTMGKSAYVAQEKPVVPIAEDTRTSQTSLPISEPVKKIKPFKKNEPAKGPELTKKPAREIQEPSSVLGIETPIREKIIKKNKKTANRPPKQKKVPEVITKPKAITEPAEASKPAEVSKPAEASLARVALPTNSSLQKNVPPLPKNSSVSQSEEISAKQYFNAIRQMIEKNRRYPQMARRRNQEGSVRVRFLIDSNGNVNSLEIVKRSDYESLNQAALEAVKRAAPFSKPPAYIDESALKLELTINFKLI